LNDLDMTYLFTQAQLKAWVFFFNQWELKWQKEKPKKTTYGEELSSLTTIS
jgi:hypothetical protein